MGTEAKSTLVTIRATHQERDLLNKAAAQRGVTVAALVRSALAKQGVHLQPTARNTSDA